MGEARLVTMRGVIPLINQADLPADIWGALGPYAFLVAAELVEVNSTSADDTAAGTGVRSVRIRGLGPALDHQTEVLTLAGITPVATTLQYVRVNSLESLTVGTGLRNAGLLAARGATGGTLLSRVEVMLGRSLVFVYSVAAGRSLWINSFLLKSTNTVSDAAIRVRTSTLMSRSLASGIAAPAPFLALYHSIRNIDGSGIVDQRFVPPMLVEGPADVRCELPLLAFPLNGTSFDAYLSGWEMDATDVPPPLQSIRAERLPPSQG